MSEENDFRQKRYNEIAKQRSSNSLQSLTRQWMNESIKTNYSYHFEWLGRPVIHIHDIVGTQQLLLTIQPDLIIETVTVADLDFLRKRT